MIEIDILKASNHNQIKPLSHSCYHNDDNDMSEPDTALNTPTGSLTDSITRRYSYSSSSSFKNYPSPQRKPSFTPKSPDFFPQQSNHHDLLEKKIQALENDISEHVKREAELESQVFLLTEQQKGVQYKSTLTRISKQIDQFLVTHEEGTNKILNNNKNSGYWDNDEWVGHELPMLYEYQDMQQEVETEQVSSNTSDMTTIPITLIFRLKAIMENFALQENTDPRIQEFSTEVYRALDAWQVFYHKKIVIEKENKIREQSRITRLLEALQKSILRNKIMKQDHALLTKKYKADMKEVMLEINLNKLFSSTAEEQQFSPQKQKQKKEQEIIDQKVVPNEDTSQKTSTFIRGVLETQIRTLEKDLFKCQDERDEYESTLEMVRREMETMLEELDDTRQQRLRYKTQASRLRAGLEAIQKRQAKNNQQQSDEEYNSNDDEEEDEGKEAMRLMYNEAERQAIDLDRECKRQTLTLNSIRQELKLTQEKLRQVQAEKDQELKILQRTNQRLTRDIEMLRVEKHELVSLQQHHHHQLSSSQSKTSINTTNSSTVNNDEEDMDKSYLAKIHALQTTLKAAKSDAVNQRTKISQLERQASLVDLSHSFIAGLQDLFQKELAVSVKRLENNVNIDDIREMANIIETEQKMWKHDSLKSFQKQYDIDVLRVNRELRFLSCKLNDVEDEMNTLQARHIEDLSLLKFQTNAEFQKKLQRVTSVYRSKEQELQAQLESLFQKNQTLEDESVILYGRNMLMAHQLGKIAP
ncbi:hypothetical protein BD770DRAFT_458427 [Pilaira anomala]|nr:hypothetical protein BD770DRAFT_458427 [Pilaira anomala]